MKVVNSVLDLIGQTPVVRLNRMVDDNDAEVYVKLEKYNPAGSIKDRPALYMIEKGEKEGILKKGSIILEATSGNTGIGLAMTASIKGYPIVIVMPENMSEERKKILTMYGAELVLTPANKGMPGAVAKAHEMAAADPHYYLINQFENPDNAESHAIFTGKEIMEQMDRDVDAVVIGVGSGGTIAGVAKVFKQEMPDTLIIAIEPANSAVLSGKSPGTHEIQGIGAGFIPPILNTNLIDEVIAVKDEEAVTTCKELARKEALLVGISSGAAVYGALQIAHRLGKGKKILAIAPDGADKYMSTILFD